ncbi:peptide ABC transporter substrate-binding protein [Planctomycetota bacterium]|nr:peptide ABC transporter substrate-binding protein [Planctomycetota bacterium]
MLKSFMAGVIVLASNLVLMGCGTNVPEADVTFISGAGHNTLDPQRMSWVHDFRVARSLYETLVRYDFAKQVIEPGVAERWDVSEDGKTYTFHIRTDAKWSNGEPIKSSDFYYAWLRVCTPDQASDYSELFYPIKGVRAFYNWRLEQISNFATENPNGNQEVADQLWEQTKQRYADTVGVKMIDERTIEVELERPTPYFLELVAFITYVPTYQPAIMENSAINADTATFVLDPTYWSDPKRLITNGPYVLKKRAFKQYMLMTMNEHYWNKGAMKNQSVLERIIENPETALRTYEDGREGIDFWPDVPTAGSIAELLISASDSGQRNDVHTIKAAGTYFYNFNCINPRTQEGNENPLLDPRVRKAMAMAIDRNYLVNRVTRIHQPIARTFVPPGSIAGYEAPVQDGLTFSPEQANELLAEAGYPNGRGFPTLTLLYNTGNLHEQPAQAVVKMWEDNLGIKVNLQGIETKVFGDRLKNKEFDISRAGWFGDYPDPTTFLNKLAAHSNNNDAGWDNKEYNDLLTKAADTVNHEQRYKVLEDAEALMVEQAPMALIYQYIQIYLYDESRVKGLSEQENAWNKYYLEYIWVEPSK